MIDEKSIKMAEFYRLNNNFVCSPFTLSAEYGERLGSKVTYLGEKVLGDLEISEKSVCVDLGCGTGHLLGWLHENKRIPPERLLGLDLKDFRSSQTKRLFIHQLGDLNSSTINLLEDTYDWCFCTEVLEHVRCPMDVLNNVSRCLKTGGRFFVSVPSYSNVCGVLKFFLDRYLYKRPCFAPFGRWSLQESESHMRAKTLIDFLEKSGFRIVKYRTFWHLDATVPFLMLLPDRVCYSELLMRTREYVDRVVPRGSLFGLQAYILAEKK